MSDADDASPEDLVALVKHQRLSGRRGSLGFVEFDKNRIPCLEMNLAVLVRLTIAGFRAAV